MLSMFQNSRDDDDDDDEYDDVLAPRAISAWQFSDIRSNARVELNFKSISTEKNKREV